MIILMCYICFSFKFIVFILCIERLFLVVVYNLLLIDLSMWILIYWVLVNIVKDFNVIVSFVEWLDVFVGMF